MSLEDPLFPVTITVGGTGQSYKIAAFPKEMHANQSFILQATLQKDSAGGGGAFDIGASTATLFVSGWKNNISPVTLVTGVISDSGSGTNDRVTFTVPKDLIPSSLGGLPLRKPGNSVFYFILEDVDSVLQFFQQVNVIDTNYTLSGDVDSSPNVIIPDKNDLGTVIQVNLNTPPVSPTFMDAYIVGTAPTGDWIGQDNDLTVFNGSSWVFYDTIEGDFAFDSNTSQQFTFNGTVWAATAAASYSDGESINDNNSNELITFGVTASAVNDVKITNSATAVGPTIAANGDDANIDLNINAKGTGNIKTLKTVQQSKGADVASATALPLINDGNYFDVTGTTTITSFDSIGVGSKITLHFDGILTLSHNATTLILPGAANVTTSAGDEFTFIEYAPGDWRCISYALASGEAIVGGSGGVSVGVYRDIYIDAAAMVPRSTNGAEALTKEFATNDIMIDYLAFDSTTEEGAQFKMMIPDEWDRSTIKLKFFWDAAATASGTVVWGVSAGALSDGDVIDTALGTEVTVTDTLQAVGDMHISPATAAVTVGGTPALADMIIFQIVAKTSGTIAVDQLLMGVAIQYKEGTTNPVIW